MTLKDAREFRDYIQSKCSLNCTVPLGFGPADYLPTSVMRDGPRRWQSKAEFRTWLAQYIRERRNIHRRYEQMVSAQATRRARSPLDIMIDQACGLN
jgi:hypothetical protein